MSQQLVMPDDRRRLTASERLRVALEIVSTYCRSRWWLATLDFPEAVDRARATGMGPSDQSEEAAQQAGLRLGAAVVRTLRTLPVDGRCLVTALVLTRMLARRGITTTFVLGVRSRPQFGAHAWLERGGLALLPTTADFQRLREI